MKKPSEIRLGPSWVLRSGSVVLVLISLGAFAVGVVMLGRLGTDPDPEYQLQVSMITLTGFLGIIGGITGLGYRTRLDERGILSYFVLGTKAIQLRYISWSGVIRLNVIADGNQPRGLSVMDRKGRKIATSLAWRIGAEAVALAATHVPEAAWAERFRHYAALSNLSS